MRTLKSILNEKSMYLAIGILIVFIVMAIFGLRSTYELHKGNAVVSTKLLADYFEPTLIFESKEDFENIVNKLDFEGTYRGITIYDKADKLFAFKGEVVDTMEIDEPSLTNRRLFTKADILKDNEVIGTLYMSFSISKLENEMLINLGFIVFIFCLMLIGFYLYVKELNEIVISPVNKLINAIYEFGGEEEMEMGSIESPITEINDLKENFSNLILQLNFSKIQLEMLNKNLEEKVRDKTKKLTIALNETKRFQKKIIAQEKLASLGGLSAGIAHEIKNPLNLIINGTQLVDIKLQGLNEFFTESIKDLNSEQKEQINSEVEEIKEVCDIINSSGRRADRIIKGMLSQARSQSSKKEEQNLSEICKQGLSLAYHSMRAKEDVINIEVIDNIESNIVHVCYAEEIERAIINLLDNSFDAVKEKKLKCPEYKPVVKVSLNDHAGIIQIVVEDNGPGIPKTLLEKVKEPFFTTKPTGKGTGLGMSMINDIITSQSGEFLIESVEGKSTIVKISFPKLSNTNDIAS